MSGSSILVMILAGVCASWPVRAQTVSAGFAVIHVAPEELNWASGMELSLQLGPRGAPFEFTGSYRYVQRDLRSDLRSSEVTCQSYWPSYEGCRSEPLHREASMSTWMCGILFEPSTHPGTHMSFGIGLEVNRVTASGHGETTGRQISIYGYDGTLGAVALLAQGGFRPVASLPVELAVAFKVETTTFGGGVSDAAWALDRASGVLAWSVGARYRIRD